MTQRIKNSLRYFFCCLGLLSVACAPHVYVDVDAKAIPLPLALTWTALPGTGMTSLDIPAMESVVRELIPALEKYDWYFTPLPLYNDAVDVVIRIAWHVSEPSGEFVMAPVPLTPDSPEWGIYPWLYLNGIRITAPIEEPKYVVMYTRSLTLEAMWAKDIADVLLMYNQILSETMPKAIAWPDTAPLLWTVKAQSVSTEPLLMPYLQDFARAAISQIGNNTHIGVDVKGDKIRITE